VDKPEESDVREENRWVPCTAPLVWIIFSQSKYNKF
jgi:hypothetical protein